MEKTKSRRRPKKSKSKEEPQLPNEGPELQIRDLKVPLDVSVELATPETPELPLVQTLFSMAAPFARSRPDAPPDPMELLLQQGTKRKQKPPKEPSKKQASQLPPTSTTVFEHIQLLWNDLLQFIHNLLTLQLGPFKTLGVMMLWVSISGKIQRTHIDFGGNPFQAVFHSGHNTSANTSTPNVCIAKSSIIAMVNESTVLPEHVGEKPRYTLRAPCLFSSFEEVASTYRGAGSWIYIPDSSGATVEVLHRFEKPILLRAGFRHSKDILQFLKENRKPQYGLLTQEAYSWSIAHSKGFVLSAFDPKWKSLREQQAAFRPFMEELAATLPDKFFTAFVDAQDKTTRRWLRSEFGVTTFPTVIVQKHAGVAPFFALHGEERLSDLVQTAIDVFEGCLGYEPPARTFNGHCTPPEVRHAVCKKLD